VSQQSRSSLQGLGLGWGDRPTRSRFDRYYLKIDQFQPGIVVYDYYTYKKNTVTVMKQWISELRIENLRSFSSAEIKFSSGINILIGRNNSGKSTILQAMLLLQSQVLVGSDIRRISSSTPNAVVEIFYLGDETTLKSSGEYDNFHRYTISSGNRFDIVGSTGSQSSGGWDARFKPVEPQNLIYPYLSKRKVGSFSEAINESCTNLVQGNFTHLVAKIDRLINPDLPSHRQYRKACQEILGFSISTTASANGKKAVYIVDDFNHISLDAMGEGISNLLGLIVDLCIAKDKVFLIEEPENDIHPLALKKLMDLIYEKSTNNQFIITTHSNIVLKHLGSHPESKIFKVDMKFQDQLPTSSVSVADQSPESRREILEDLDYELYDFDLWKAWLFLEESSAEKIIREYLVPWFTPKLSGKLRTFSAGSRDQVPMKFDDFNRLFVFLHLEASYKDRAWIVIDSGEEEEKIISQLKTKYKSWNSDCFRTWDQHDFESYYPSQFEDQIKQTLSIANKKDKREAKKELLEDVESWINQDESTAKESFSKSAQFVINILKDIENQVCQENII
jgi:predicted ATPase